MDEFNYKTVKLVIIAMLLFIGMGFTSCNACNKTNQEGLTARCPQMLNVCKEDKNSANCKAVLDACSTIGH